MQRFSSTLLNVMCSQHWLSKACQRLSPFSNKTPEVYEDFNQVTRASNWDVMLPSYSVNKDQNLEIGTDFLGRNNKEGAVCPLIYPMFNLRQALKCP